MNSLGGKAEGRRKTGLIIVLGTPTLQGWRDKPQAEAERLIPGGGRVRLRVQAGQEGQRQACCRR